jgi:hypothetical protein
MIVTAFPRSGATRYCIDMAEHLGKNFADEPFQRSIVDQAGVFQKPLTHEAYTNYTKQTKFDSEYVKNNLDNFVVLNHRTFDSFLLANTHIFILRQDLSQVAESWIYLFGKSAYSREQSLEWFHIALKNIENICEHLLANNYNNVIKCENLYQFTHRPTDLYFPQQELVDKVYAEYNV